MRRFLVALTVLAITVSSLRADSQDEARAVIARAVKALGGEALAAKSRTMHARLKGTIHDLEMTPPFTGEVYIQLPDRSKLSLVIEVAGQKLGTTQVFQGRRGWVRIDTSDSQDNSPADLPTLVDMQQSAYVDNLANLVPLLSDRRYSLSLHKGLKVQGQPAVGVKVRLTGKPDILLYFDPGTGLLTKSEYQRKEHQSGNTVLREEFFLDYREVNSAKSDEETLKKAKLGTSDADLLGYLRSRTITPMKRDQIRSLIKKLGDSSFEVRDNSKKQLIALGEQAAPTLSSELRNSDAEIASGVKECLDAIGKTPDPNLPRAVLRLLAQRKLAGTADAILDYLPSAPGDVVLQEGRAALAAVATHDGKPAQVVVDAEKDKDPIRRSAAAFALGHENDRPGQRCLAPGLKVAMKGLSLKDGRKTMEWELEDVQFFNRFDDAVFGKP